MKKSISIILAILMCLSCFGFLYTTATANTDFTEGHYTYTVSDGKAMIVSVYKYLNGNVTVPSELGGYPVVAIGDNAFHSYGVINSITIPASVEFIGDLGLGGHNLETIIVDKNNKHYCNDSYGVLYNKDKTQLILYPAKNPRTSYSVSPETTTIKESAFTNSLLEKIILPVSITNIEANAFSYCTNLRSINIPPAVSTIREGTFFKCDSLLSIEIPNTVSVIENGAFASCEMLYNITIPDTVNYIGNLAFSHCGYHSVESNWIENVLYIGNHLVETRYDGLAEVYSIKEGTITIAEGAFSDKDVSEIYIPASVKNIGNFAFRTDSLKKITVSNNSNTFSSDSQGVLFNKDKTELIQYSCSNPAKAYMIPDTVRLIKDCAFLFIYNLKDIYYAKSENEWSKIIIEDNNSDLKDCVIHYNSCQKNEDFSHKYMGNITHPATHLTEGVMTFTCACGDLYTEAIDKLPEHTYCKVITAPTCLEQGYTTYTCTCGDSYIGDYTDVAEHNDADGDGLCDFCNLDITPEDEGSENDCSHLCHKTGFMGFIWKIVQFFWKLFNMNPVCECGAYHY